MSEMTPLPIQQAWAPIATPRNILVHRHIDATLTGLRGYHSGRQRGRSIRL